MTTRGDSELHILAEADAPQQTARNLCVHFSYKKVSYKIQLPLREGLTLVVANIAKASCPMIMVLLLLIGLSQFVHI